MLTEGAIPNSLTLSLSLAVSLPLSHTNTHTNKQDWKKKPDPFYGDLYLHTEIRFPHLGLKWHSMSATPENHITIKAWHTTDRYIWSCRALHQICSACRTSYNQSHLIQLQSENILFPDFIADAEYESQLSVTTHCLSAWCVSARLSGHHRRNSPWGSKRS